MKKILSLILCGVLLVACGNNTKSEVKEEKKTEKTTETKESKPTSTGVHTFDSPRDIKGTNYIYSQFNYDRNVGGYLQGGRYYGPSTGENAAKNHAEFFVGNDGGQLKEQFQVKDESEFITKLFLSSNDLFYFHFKHVVQSSYGYRLVTINKETKKTINGIEYLNLEFKVDFWVSEESYQRKKDKPEATAFVNGYFTLLDGTDGGKVPFYAMQAWEDGAGEAAKAKALAVLEEVLTTVRKK